MAANDAVSMNVAENRQNVPMAIQENRAAVPMTVAEGGGTPGGLNRKADKVTGAAAGNLAGLDSTGNLTDSGKAPGDFLEAPATAGSEGQVLTADGEGGASWQDPTGVDPTEIIDDTAGDGDTDKVWSADKSHELLTEINSKADEPTGTKSAGKVYGLDNDLNPAWVDGGGGSVDPSVVEQKVNAWLSANITNPDSPPLDRSLTSTSGATPADLGGDAKNGIKILNEQIPALNGNVLPPAFEIGLRYVSGGAEAWATNNKRLSTKRGEYVELKKGDTITIDRSVLLEYGACYSTDGGETFTALSSSSLSSTAPEDGLYFFWMCKNDSAVVTQDDVENGWKYLRFTRANSVANTVDSLGSVLKVTNEQFPLMTGTIIPPPFEIGVRYVLSNADVWAANSKRLTFKRWEYITLKQNDVVSVDSSVVNEFAGGYSTDGGSTFTSISSRSDDYVAPADGIYFFWISKVGDTAFTADDIEKAWTYIRFSRSVAEKPLTNEQILKGATGKNNSNLIDGEIVLSGDFSYRNYASTSATSIGFILLNVPNLNEGDDIEFSWDEFVNPLSDYSTAVTFYLNKRNSGGTSIGYAYLTPDKRYVVEANVKSVEFVAQVDYSSLPSSRWVVAELNGVVVVRGDSLHINAKYLPQTWISNSGEYLKPNHIYSSGSILRRCYNPYKDAGSTAYVGQLHCHAKEKVNDEWIYYGGSVEGLCELFAECGYDFITVTDYAHNGEITHKPSNTHGLVWLCDAQETATDANSGLVGQHMCVYNCTELYSFPRNTQPHDIADIVKADNCACDLAHPAWSVLYQNPDKVAKIKGKIRFCEVYDGLNDIQGAITVPTGKSTDYAWEIMLDNGCVVWGTAVNDAHTGHDEDGGISKGCVKVYASAKTPEAIWKALCTGCFISCSHVSADIDSVSVVGNTITINTGDSGASTKFLKEEGTVLSTQTGTTATYSMDGSEKYVRAVVTLSSGETVWIQPVVNITKVALDDYDLTY